jgi:NOL1/NOP2/fmu family ribosome biogenesis protein
LRNWLREDLEIFSRGEDILQAMPALMAEDAPALSGMLHIRQMGVELGKLAKEQLIPAHALALSTAISDDIPKLDLTWEQAIAYLQKKELQADGEGIKGWALASYENIPLGWVKVLPNRINSFYPTEFRLRKEFDTSEEEEF